MLRHGNMCVLKMYDRLIICINDLFLAADVLALFQSVF